MSRLPPKAKGLLWVVAALMAAAIFTVGLPGLVRAVPWGLETALGRALGLKPATPSCSGYAERQALLDRVVGRLFPLMPDDRRITIHVEIVDAAVVNAYATLGGNIYVNSGLIEKAGSAEEVAAVLAHEIEHVERRHILQNVIVRLFTSAGLLYITSGHDAGLIPHLLAISFTRTQESEADEGGLRRLQLAHIDNRGFTDFFSRTATEPLGARFLSDHPGNRERVATAERFENQDPRPVMTPAEWAGFKAGCR
jgi:beta-barrel assembly-enhancing protease